MNQSYDYSAGSSPQRTSGRGPYRDLLSRPLLIAVGVAFLLGVVLTQYLSYGWDLGLSRLFSLRDGAGEVAAPADDASGAPIAAAPSPTPSASQSAQAVMQEAREATERAEQVVEQAGGIDSRVAAMEQRLTRLDIAAQSAAGNAARAEGLLIAFAARRQLERGQPLGYLADQLRLRFGEARPNAVQTVIDASQDPVTLDRLVARLDGLAPVLTDSPADENMFTTFARQLSSLFVVRRQSTPSPRAQQRLERARFLLESGRIEAAASEIRLLPNAAEAEDWLGDADRFAAAQRALETLETVAVLDPRELRNASGQQVEQLSPAQPTGSN